MIASQDSNFKSQIQEWYLDAVRLYNQGFRNINQKRNAMTALNTGYHHLTSVYRKELTRANDWRQPDEWREWVKSSDYKCMLLPERIQQVTEKDILKVIRLNSWLGLTLRDMTQLMTNIKNTEVLPPHASANPTEYLVKKRVMAEHKKNPEQKNYTFDASDIFNQPVTVEFRKFTLNTTDNRVEYAIVYKYEGHVVPLIDILENRIDEVNTTTENLVMN